MHLQQTKQGSSKSGGPQYYFHNLDESVRIYLRSKGIVRVALVTPYGATKTDFFAVGKDHKLGQKNGVFLPQAGSVGHDRIQMGNANESIGEAIRHWFKLPSGQFERIDLKLETIDDSFYLTPTKVKYSAGQKAKTLVVSHRPLTFERAYVSPFWSEQITNLGAHKVEWSFREIARIVKDHYPVPSVPYIKEEDLLRASGALERLGVVLGPYVGKGYDCRSEFQFLNLQSYPAPIEVKKLSANFKYQEKKYGKDELSRAVILCAVHNHSQLPGNIDVIELAAFPDYAKKNLGLSL